VPAKFEIQVNKLEILGDSDAEKFRYSQRNRLDFYENAHLRVVRICFARVSVYRFVHSYFQEKACVCERQSSRDRMRKVLKGLKLPLCHLTEHQEQKMEK
jgi:hypothetical protein